ncbi:MAG: formylglycine-generating enzyme family protein, partial [Patescibacteria group bacterium]|nr:formylglycine-generating enzyme family protein [Patescibacteria group bacterium]
MNTESFDPYHRWLSIPPREQPPDHYRLLGVQRFESDPNVIENAADKQMAHLRSVQSGKHGPLSQQLLNEVAAAHVCLLNADRKAAYDTKLREQLAAETVSGSPGEPVFPLPREPEAFPVLEAADTANVRVRRGRPSPVLLAASALAAIALLGTLAWHITGLEHDNAETPPVAPRKAERPVAARRLEEPARPPGRASAPERHQFADGNEPNPASTIAVELPGPPESQHTPTAPSLAVVPFNAAQARQHQEAWASHLGVPVEWTNSIGMKFVLIPPGEFHMGSPENEGERSTEKTRSDGALHANNGRNRSETPQHRVRITQAFFLGICEVSQAEYKSVMGRNPSSFSAEGKDAGKVASLDTDGHPVDSITCAEASAFCETLSARPQEKAAGRVYTLPAEAQWEYACRAGTATEWSCDDDGRVLGQYAWFDGNSGRTTHEVGKRLPNGFGLFDVHGNVWEWCADRFDEGYYAISPVDDPPGPESGSVGVIRGGSWGHDAKRCRSATRHPYGLTLRFHTVGVRVACVPGGMRGQSDVVAVAPPTAHDDGPTVLTPPEEPPAEGPQAPETAKAKRKPVPAVSAQQEIRRKIDDLCGTVTLHKPDEALALANKLAALAEKAGDAAERFVLLRRASELASDANNLQRMLELLNRIVEEFEVDRVTVQCAMLTAFAKRATGETQIGALVDASAGPLDETLAAERFDLADALSASVYRACQASAGREFRVDALARRREVQELRKRWEEVQAALAALTSSPDDEAAHSVVGAWCWFVRNDWDRALPHLAKGSDPALRKLADRELNSPPENPVAQVELADAWWE